MTMSPLVRRILQWSGYICIATGFIGGAFGVVSVAQLFLGSANDRVNYISTAFACFGGGCADLLLGYGLLWIGRSAMDHR